MKKGNIINSIIKDIESKENNQQNQQNYKHFSSTDKADTSERQITLVKKQKNLYRRIINFLPNIKQNRIYKVFGFIGINEMAIEDQNYCESFFNTHFFDRVIRKVQIGKNAVVIDFQGPSIKENQVPIQYIIQRYKSKGNKEFNQIAELLSQLYQIFTGLKMNNSTEDQKKLSFNKTLESLGNDMFVCTNGISQVAISKSLLTYLEYDIQEFAVTAIKYRSIFTEFFSAKQYFAGVKHFINMINCLVDFKKGLISMKQLRELSTLSMTDFIYSKNGVKSYCSSSLFMINMEYLCHRVDLIYYRSDQIKLAIKSCSLQQTLIQDQKLKIQQNELQIIKEIKQIPGHLLNENKAKIVNYKIISEEMIDEKTCDDKYLQT